jgi:hypothetical protein
MINSRLWLYRRFEDDQYEMMTWFYVQCDWCPWNTTYIREMFRSEDDARRWCDAALHVDIDASEDADEWIYFDESSAFFHFFLDGNAMCLHCMDRDEQRRRFEKKHWDPRWTTEAVVSIAEAIRAEMPPPLCLEPIGLEKYGPVLHDALMDAGCDQEAIYHALTYPLRPKPQFSNRPEGLAIPYSYLHDMLTINSDDLAQTILDTILGMIT